MREIYIDYWKMPIDTDCCGYSTDFRKHLSEEQVKLMVQRKKHNIKEISDIITGFFTKITFNIKYFNEEMIQNYIKNHLYLESPVYIKCYYNMLNKYERTIITVNPYNSQLNEYLNEQKEETEDIRKYKQNEEETEEIRKYYVERLIAREKNNKRFTENEKDINLLLKDIRNLIDKFISDV